MIFAVLFVVAFLIGVLVYIASNRWILAVCIPTFLYVTIVLLDEGFTAESALSLVFGLPITSVGGLLAAYVVELRRGLDDEHQPEESLEPASEQEQS